MRQSNQKETGENRSFFCQACLTDKLSLEQSPDPRYCHFCYDFLLKEAKMLPASKCPVWIPKPQSSKMREKRQYQIAQVGDVIMSTSRALKNKVDIITPSISYKEPSKRGPRFRVLPEDLITQFANKGMGSKAIATRLRSEVGIQVSYKTIQRLLSGQRKQPCFK